jgi:hypothetical protein
MRLIRLSITLLLATFICLAVLTMSGKTAFESQNDYFFFVGNTSADCKVVYANANSATLTKLITPNICGEGTTYTKIDVSDFLADLDGQVVFTEELSDSVNYYCTANLPYSIELYGQTINLHISVKDDSVMVATPIIFGGY